MISGPQQFFAEEIVRGRSAGEAYRIAYPKASAASAETAGPRLFGNVQVMAEIERMRRGAEKLAGSAVLELAEVHRFLARIARARPALEPEDSDLWQSIKRTDGGVECRLPDKLGAISRWADLASKGVRAKADDSLGELLKELRK